jgi:hypothetical protein
MDIALKKPEQRQRLESLTAATTLPNGIRLPLKDAPILLCAIECGATHLLTGDGRHFGPYYDTVIAGVLILSPAAYCKARSL